MIHLRKSKDRGHFSYEWLDTFHTFSFAEYHDEKHMGFGPLRVINEDIVAPGRGFETHPHRDMEILTYVLNGTLEHKDSLGNGSQITHGTIQRISAGRGVLHSEFNPSPSTPVHLLQIWIQPNKLRANPRYSDKTFPIKENSNNLTLIASENGEQDSLQIYQNAKMYAALLHKGVEIVLPLTESRMGWLQVARGQISIQAHSLVAGDGAGLENINAPTIKAEIDSEIIFFDLPN